MTNSEFSDTFTTLLNSYNTQAQFGEQASKREIVLDEYEKSVLLTQAQDIIVKSYFDATLNNQSQGFDDSTRRQMDFSSLIKVAELRPLSLPYTGNTHDMDLITSESAGEKVSAVMPFDNRGIIYQLPRKTYNNTNDSTGYYDGTQTYKPDTTDVLFILNERLIVRRTITPSKWSKSGQSDVIGDYTDATAEILPKDSGVYANVAAAEADGWSFYNGEYKDKDYVIVPISYKEYDREMSKPYAQPLKKQAWRLFQNSAVGFDVNSELIPKFNVKQSQTVGGVGTVQFVYKIRYVKRPRPIILESLPNDLEIDGETQESSCELNPIIHMDILNKAVELAVSTRGGSIPQPPQQGAVRRQREE